MSMTSTTYCKDCIYWDITRAGTTTRAREGRCRRHAPTPRAEDMNLDFGTVWPATFDDDWCGEGRRPGDGGDGGEGAIVDAVIGPLAPGA